MYTNYSIFKSFSADIIMQFAESVAAVVSMIVDIFFK